MTEGYYPKERYSDMAFDKTWEEIFRTKEWGKYPPEELVRFIARNYYNVLDRKKVKILDIGCGTGSCIWFMAKEGFDVYGIDGSKTAISIAKKRLQDENLSAHLKEGDFINLEYPKSYFDCITDISSLQHNSIADIKIILSQVKGILKPSGKVFSVMNSNATNLKKDVNLFTEKRVVNYFSEKEVIDMFSIFDEILIDSVTRTDNVNSNIISRFLICATKK